MKQFITRASVATGVALAVPMLAFAQQRISGILETVESLITVLTGILVSVAVLLLFYNIVMYIWGQGGAEDKQKAMSGIWKSLLAIGIMLTFFGIIKIVANTLQVDIGDEVTGDDIGGVETQF